MAKLGRPPKKSNGKKPEINVEAQQRAADDAAMEIARDMELMQFGDGDIDWENMPNYGSVPIQGKLGVLQRMVTAVMQDREYRQVLLLAAFDNKQEALLAADAISERQRYGVTIAPIVDRVIAQCAVKSDRMSRVLAAMSQHVLTTQWNNIGKKKDDGGRLALSQ